MKIMSKKKIVWQADAFELIAPSGGPEAFRAPVGLVFDPHEPFILASRIFPPGFSEPACLRAAVEEAMLTYGVTPAEVHVRWGKEKLLMSLAAKAGFTLTLCDELRELAAVKEDMAAHLRSVFAAAEPEIGRA
jgi:hypothetical protein